MRAHWTIVALVAALLSTGCVDPAARGDGAPTVAPAPAERDPAPVDDTEDDPGEVRLSVAVGGLYPILVGYDPSELEVPSGANVTVSFTNNDLNPLGKHDWFVEDVDGAATEVIPVGETVEVSFIAPAAGTYAFYCSVPTHRDRGIEGTFTAT